MAVIEVQHFKKSFGDKLVHKDISFSLKKGECLGLIGGSGTGKSVLLRSLIGLEKPDSGELFYDGQSLSGLSENEWFPFRKKMAYVFQGGALFDSMNVYENLAYPLREHTHLNEQQIEQEIRSVLRQFGLEDSLKLLPSSLSGGMQKRVGLARAIILKPDVVLYDEPTAGLDPFNTKRIEEMILRLSQTGVTSILVTHDMPVAKKVCNRILVLKNGELVSNDEVIQRFSSGETL